LRDNAPSSFVFFCNFKKKTTKTTVGYKDAMQENQKKKYILFQGNGVTHVYPQTQRDCPPGTTQSFDL
jgi:hypothetical protein